MKILLFSSQTCLKREEDFPVFPQSSCLQFSSPRFSVEKRKTFKTKTRPTTTTSESLKSLSRIGQEETFAFYVFTFFCTLHELKTRPANKPKISLCTVLRFGHIAVWITRVPKIGEFTFVTIDFFSFFFLLFFELALQKKKHTKLEQNKTNFERTLCK